MIKRFTFYCEHRPVYKIKIIDSFLVFHDQLIISKIFFLLFINESPKNTYINNTVNNNHYFCC
jgi:hypothetical protein